MKILLVNWRCIKNPEMGGAEVHLHEIFRRVVKKNHDVTLIAHKFNGAKDEETIDGIKIKRIGNKFLFDKQFKIYFKTKISKSDFDLIVDDISKIPLNIPSYSQIPTVGILHHIHGNSLLKEIPKPLAFYIMKKERQIPVFYKSSKIFTVSESTSSELVNLGYDRNKTAILRNAIDHKLFESVKIEKNESPTICYVGRIKKYKNINLIIEAVKKVTYDFPNIKLFVGGKGDHLSNLRAQVKRLNLEKNVEFTGFLSEEEKAELLAKSWLFVTMAEKEGWGITVIEANAVRTPAIGSNVEGLRDSIRDKETGLLVPAGNTYQLAERIKNLISDKAELERLSNNAYKWSQEFSWEKSADFFLEKVVYWYPELKSKI